jgi:hypothetical protein
MLWARLGNVLLGVAGKRADALAFLKQLPERASGFGDLGRQSVHLDIALVAQDQPRRAVEHA